MRQFCKVSVLGISWKMCSWKVLRKLCLSLWYFLLENCRKHLTRQFYKISVFGGMVSWKNVCVLTKYRESSPGKFDLFLWYFFLLMENLMCSNEILDKISWKFWSVLMIFLPPGKSHVFLQNFEKALLEILICSSIFCLSWKIYINVLIPFLVLLENLMSSSGNLEVFLLYSSLLENLMCSRNLAREKKEQIF